MTTKSINLFCVLAISAILGFGYYLEIFHGFNPCPLCSLQRIAFFCAGVMFMLGFIFSRNRLTILIGSLFANLFSIAGFLVASRQTWLQLHPSPDAECGVSLNYMLEVLPWHEVVAKVFQGSTDCSDKAWQFLTLTMPEWAMFLFSVFFILSLVVFTRGIRGKYD